jgi:hypothetical protein
MKNQKLMNILAWIPLVGIFVILYDAYIHGSILKTSNQAWIMRQKPWVYILNGIMHGYIVGLIFF